MKTLLHAFVMCQSMFCSIPCPFAIWDEKARPKMLLFLPAVGLEIGLLWVVLNGLLRSFKIPNLVYGLVMCAFPYSITGFIHLDGFMDVVDAISSWRDLEQRRKILKDSHAGSFAVIWCVFLLLAGVALFASAPDNVNVWCLSLIPVVSRCCSAIAVLYLKSMETSQYAQTQQAPLWHRYLLVMVMFGCMGIGFFAFGKHGFSLMAGFVGYVAALWWGYRSLDGMNGDISGFCLTISELCAIAVYALI